MSGYILIPVLCLVSVLGVLMSAVKLPGTWLIVLVAAGLGWAVDWEGITVLVVVILVGIAVVGEVIEFLASVLVAKKAGASRKAAWGGLIGGILGMFVFSLPMPIVGTIAGAIIGCFVGAVIGELFSQSKLDKSARVGFFSVLGYVLGMVAKMALALAMAVVLVTSVVCSTNPSPPAKIAIESPSVTTQPLAEPVNGP